MSARDAPGCDVSLKGAGSCAGAGVATPERRPARDRVFLAALGIGQICSWGTLYYSFPQISSAMAADFGWGRSQQYGALTLGLLLSGLISYPIGAAIDRGHGRSILAGASVAAGGLLLALSQIHSLAGFYAVYAALGALFAATLYDPAFAVVGRRYGAAMSRNGITALTLWGGFASTVFIPAIEALMAAAGWRDALMALGLVNLGICAPLYARAIRPGLDRGNPSGAAQASAFPVTRGVAIAQLARRGRFWMVGAFFLAQAALMSAFTFHLYPLLSERGLSATGVVGIIAVIGPAQVAGRVLIWVFAPAASIAAIGSVTVGVLIGAVAEFALAGTSVWALAAVAAAYGAANGVLTIVRGMAVPELLTAAHYGAINGLLAGPSTLVKATAPVALALLWEHFGSQAAAMTALVACALVMAGAFWAAARLSLSGPADLLAGPVR